MSHILGEDIESGKELISGTDVNDPDNEPTQGSLSHGDAQGKAEPLKLSKELNLLVEDDNVTMLLALLIEELREIKFLFRAGMG